METSNLVHIQQFCISYDVEFSFLDSLQEHGLIEFIVIEENKYISHEQLKDLEKIIYFHNELHINLEGIDAISHLLRQINDLQQELQLTKNKLRLFDFD